MEKGGESKVDVGQPAVRQHSTGGSSKKLISILSVIVVLEMATLVGVAWWAKHHKTTETATVQPAIVSKPKTITSKAEGLTLDTKKNYGNKYADGLLPVGDDHYVTDKPKAGYIYACNGYAQNIKTDPGGAETRGPWFTNNNTQYDINKKAQVQGSVTWKASFTNTVNGQTRTIVTNDLPNHTTGTFPVAATDPAYQYDRNPNTITQQAFTFALSARPTYSSTPQCMGGTVGVVLTGVVLNNGFDAGGRDAGAWEVQDSCAGHPQNKDEYHYHTLSSCIKNANVTTVLGYALDGFPITGPKVGENNLLTTSDLDECHGITSTYTLDGKSVTGYHYVMTQDFPYSISCFRATPINPPGMQDTPPAR